MHISAAAADQAVAVDPMTMFKPTVERQDEDAQELAHTSCCQLRHIAKEVLLVHIVFGTAHTEENCSDYGANDFEAGPRKAPTNTVICARDVEAQSHGGVKGSTRNAAHSIATSDDDEAYGQSKEVIPVQFRVVPLRCCAIVDHKADHEGVDHLDDEGMVPLEGGHWRQMSRTGREEADEAEARYDTGGDLGYPVAEHHRPIQLTAQG
eukprot:CAMPEP_0180441782 /NCGR_PEP_ID=MMETSP1036_2-20121128/13804_1 /TAXON_ID=632150 /ORGANISM="Azadinium spinosum, Strain 3D9" /LENGTH=207 /DNA_ID=CAMNT_0022448009 /DNA_START=140 /DNA_END=762 /DNA_ORIENTATION=+